MHEPFCLDFETAVDPALQAWFSSLDAELRSSLATPGGAFSAGLLDLRQGRLAMIDADRVEYAASIAKIGILLACHGIAARDSVLIPEADLAQLGLMIKASSNAAASLFSRRLGLGRIQREIQEAGFYEPGGRGGLWMGKHYGEAGERIPDPVSGHSHAATIRQVMRFLLSMTQGTLVSSAASAAMREAFRSPSIPHDPIHFVKGLADQDVSILRKWGAWEDWHHDAAVVEGPGRHYILAAFTHHPEGPFYLERMAAATDRRLRSEESSETV